METFYFKCQALSSFFPSFLLSFCSISNIKTFLYLLTIIYPSIFYFNTIKLLNYFSYFCAIRPFSSHSLYIALKTFKYQGKKSTQICPFKRLDTFFIYRPKTIPSSPADRYLAACRLWSPGTRNLHSAFHKVYKLLSLTCISGRKYRS